MSDRQPLRWLLWHPHQGLGNGSVISLMHRIRPRKLGRALIKLWIHIDTFVLSLRAVARRVGAVGLRRVLTGLDVPDGIDVVYLDIGTHEDGNELAWVADELLAHLGTRLRCYGFEASRASFERVSQQLGERPTIALVHAALCRDVPDGGTITLYKHGDTLSDSIHRPSSEREEVPALRLSDFLREHEPELGDAIVLLRMNIEGAEFDVVRDLIDSGTSAGVDGYFGMWDDMSKIDVERDRDFRRLLREHGIAHCTFNGRDMAWPSRLRFIGYEVGTAIRRGAERLGRTTGLPAVTTDSHRAVS